MRICFKDLFKPRYAVIVTVEYLAVDPHLAVPVPVIKFVPHKRSLELSFYAFEKRLHDRFGLSSLIFYGSKRTMKGIHGIGSLLDHNLNRPIMVAPEAPEPELPSCASCSCDHS